MNESTTGARVIAITSGKGGVGKTCLTANLAWALVKAGRKVLVLDADLGLANLDIILNLNPDVTLHDVIVSRCPLEHAIVKGPEGIHILPAASGMAEYSRLTSDLRDQLPDVIGKLGAAYDYLLLDTGAGISDVVLYTASLAQEVLVVATPEPTSLADAYATIKVMVKQQGRSHFSLVMNEASKDRGRAISQQLQQVSTQFLRGRHGSPISMTYLGAIPVDASVERSVCLRKLLMISAPQSAAAKAILELATTLENSGRPTPDTVMAS